MPDIRLMDDVRRSLLYPVTLLSQYADSPRLKNVLRAMEALMDPDPDIRAFLHKVVDVASAEGWGLDQWGKIVDIGRVIALRGDEATFGFSGSGLRPFNLGTFAAGQMDTGTFTLGDNAYRALILLKAAANISDCSVPSLNRLLRQLYGGRGAAYVLEVGTMRIRYVFEFTLQPWERALMGREDVPPKPAGVGYEVLEVDPPHTFGFAGSRLQPFNVGPFSSGGPAEAYAL